MRGRGRREQTKQSAITSPCRQQTDSLTVRQPRGKQDYQWLINLGSNSGSATTLLFALREVISCLGASVSTSVKAGVIKPT